MPRTPGVRFTTSGLVCTSCTRGVQENAAIGLVVLQTAEILGLIIIMFRNTLTIEKYVLHYTNEILIDFVLCAICQVCRY